MFYMKINYCLGVSKARVIATRLSVRLLPLTVGLVIGSYQTLLFKNVCYKVTLNVDTFKLRIKI